MFCRSAIRLMPATVSRSSSTRFAINSVVKALRPVTFPPGRASPVMTPVKSGSPLAAITMGIVAVAFLAATTAGVRASRSDRR